MSIELGTVQTGTEKVDPAQKFNCTTAAREMGQNEDKRKAYEISTIRELKLTGRDRCLGNIYPLVLSGKLTALVLTTHNQPPPPLNSTIRCIYLFGFS